MSNREAVGGGEGCGDLEGPGVQGGAVHLHPVRIAHLRRHGGGPLGQQKPGGGGCHSEHWGGGVRGRKSGERNPTLAINFCAIFVLFVDFIFFGNNANSLGYLRTLRNGGNCYLDFRKKCSVAKHAASLNVTVLYFPNCVLRGWGGGEPARGTTKLWREPNP